MTMSLRAERGCVILIVRPSDSFFSLFHPSPKPLQPPPRQTLCHEQRITNCARAPYTRPIEVQTAVWLLARLRS
eukprot:5881001-Prymnesium_polylepis.1